MLSSNYLLAKPRNDQLFEELVCEIFAFEFKNPNLQLYGHKGQQQDGIDIIGEQYLVGQDFSKVKLTAIQCKNHTVEISDRQLQEEIDKELTKLDKSKLALEQYLFVTSADNNKPVIEYVTSIRNQRVHAGKCPIFIQFWDFITDKVANNPTLLYRYFTRLLPPTQAESITLPDLHQTTRQTLSIDVGTLLDSNFQNQILPDLKEIARKNLGSITPNEPYNLYLGLSAHKNVHFKAKVDLDINLSALFCDLTDLEGKFHEIILVINNLIVLISDPFFSSSTVIYSDIEVNFALLLGRAFRMYKRNLMLVAREQVWTNNQQKVPLALQEIIEERPLFQNLRDKENEAAFIFNATTRTHIIDDVQDSLKKWDHYPNIFVSYRLKDNNIASSAHALAVAQSIAQRIHNLESWKVKTILATRQFQVK